MPLFLSAAYSGKCIPTRTLRRCCIHRKYGAELFGFSGARYAKSVDNNASYTDNLKGITRTVEIYLEHGGTDMLRGYQGAFYVGIDLAGLGVIIYNSFSIADTARKKELRMSPAP